MLWIFFVGLQVYLLVGGIRREEMAGLWSWSIFFFTIAFLAVETLIITLPLLSIDRHSHWFWWIYAAGWFLATFNFVWFLRVCRHWKPKSSST
jgi:hypothetical protein